MKVIFKDMLFRSAIIDRRIYLNSAKRFMAQDVKNWNVYVTRRVPQKGIELLSKYCNISQWSNDLPVPRDELISRIREMDALFCLLTDKIDKQILDAAGKKSCFYSFLD